MRTTEEMFGEPPDDLLSLRPNTVMALLDDEEQVKAVIDELVGAGFPKEEIYVLGGREGVEKLDPTGEKHGLRGRLVRLLERFGEETLLLERHAAHLERGGFSVVVPADDHQVSTASEILHRHGAHHAFHLGEGHWEPLGPVGAGP